MLVAVVIFIAGCRHDAEIIIPAEPAGRSQADLGLGPGVRPLTFGPGDKDSPRWGPSGKRLAFIVDGYVVEKAADTREIRRLTTRDFGAHALEWIPSGKRLAIFGVDLSKTSESQAPEVPHAIYRTSSEDLGVDRIASGALAMSPLPNGKLLAALGTEPDASILVVIDGGKVSKKYRYLVKGGISGISVSPDGGKAVMALRREPSGIFELWTLDLSEGALRRIGGLPKGQEIFGDPQWTKHGIFYVAGKPQADVDADAAPYDLYRLPWSSGKPRTVAGIGEDFVASSLQASPDGERLAVVGRRNPNSADDLYVLDLTTGVLQAVTRNENMEIKTAPEDLAWSPDGEHVAIVARGILSGHRVYAIRADALLTDFYNIYDVPVGNMRRTGDGPAG